MRTINNTVYRFEELLEEAKTVALECERYRREAEIRDRAYSVISNIFDEFCFDFDSISFDLGAVISFDWHVPKEVLIRFARDLMEPVAALEFTMLCEDVDLNYDIHTGEAGPAIVVSGVGMLPADSHAQVLLHLLKNLIQGRLWTLVLSVNRTLRSELTELYSDKTMLDSITACKVEYLPSGVPWNHQLNSVQCEKTDPNEIAMAKGGN